jgi:hypothetical protein
MHGRSHPEPFLLLLTGTDLYRDIQTDASAQRSLQQARRAGGADRRQVAAAMQAKTRVIYQSAATRGPPAARATPTFA